MMSKLITSVLSEMFVFVSLCSLTVPVFLDQLDQLILPAHLTANVSKAIEPKLLH